MKKLFSLAAIVSFILLCQSTISSCTKTNTKTITDTVTTYPIQGLWVGTYASATNGSTTYILDFSIYPDGTMTYYGTGSGNNNFYAKGTWTLSGTNFSFSVTVAGNGIDMGDTQSGTATYNSNMGILTSGSLTDATAGTSATFTMNKVN